MSDPAAIDFLAPTPAGFISPPLSPTLPAPSPYKSWVRADADGEIRHWGNSPPVDVPADAILGDASPLTHYVLAGALVAYTLDQQVAKSARPSLNHDWSNQTFTWTDRRPLADIRAAFAAGLRAQRDQLLAACDFTQLADAPVDKVAWAAYRQSLRTIPQQPGFPQTIIWPVPPS